jgi:hypothetical protein
MYHHGVWTHWAFGIGESQLNKHTTTTRLLKATAIAAALLASLGAGGTTAAGKPTPAPSGTVTWAGNGTTVTDGTLTLTDGDTCDNDNTPYLLWVLAGSKATAASISITGSSAVPMEKTNVDKKGFSSFKYEMPGPINLDNLDPVIATYDDGKNKATLTISHGCLGGNHDEDPCLEVEAADLAEECDVDPCLEVEAADLAEECDVDPCLEVEAADLAEECDVDPCLEVEANDLTDECDVDPCPEVDATDEGSCPEEECSVVPSLAGARPVTSFGNDPEGWTVTAGEWTSIPGCENTYAYAWQLLYLDDFDAGNWTTITEQTSNFLPYAVYTNDPGCVIYIRALVTATNEHGFTTESSANIALCD